MCICCVCGSISTCVCMYVLLHYCMLCVCVHGCTYKYLSARFYVVHACMCNFDHLIDGPIARVNKPRVNLSSIADRSS